MRKYACLWAPQANVGLWPYKLVLWPYIVDGAEAVNKEVCNHGGIQAVRSGTKVVHYEDELFG
jgi:hypothetical protein